MAYTKKRGWERLLELAQQHDLSRHGLHRRHQHPRPQSGGAWRPVSVPLSGLGGLLFGPEAARHLFKAIGMDRRSGGRDDGVLLAHVLLDYLL